VNEQPGDDFAVKAEQFLGDAERLVERVEGRPAPPAPTELERIGAEVQALTDVYKQRAHAAEAAAKMARARRIARDRLEQARW
jgi:hypothetical protein